MPCASFSFTVRILVNNNSRSKHREFALNTGKEIVKKKLHKNSAECKKKAKLM